MFLATCMEIFHMKGILRLSTLRLFYTFDDEDRCKIGYNKFAIMPKIKGKHLAIFHCFAVQMFSSPSFELLP